MVIAGSLPPAPRQLALHDTTVTQWRGQACVHDPAACWQRCVDHDVGVVSWGGVGYPPSIAEDDDAPPVLFHRGDPDRLDAPRVAIVGTRRATGYGLRIASRLGEELAAAGVVVVSGLALGIDAAAHRGALGLDRRDGPHDPGATTLRRAPVAAVVGAGLDAPCPVRNQRLAEQVVTHGVVLSEVPPGVNALPWRFPVRNRVIAALAEAVVVVESPATGGSMHTVREALARDRPVLAVPGPVDARTSEGTNQLLSEGAHPCLGPDDVLCAIGHVRPTSRTPEPADPRPDPSAEAAAVLEAIGWRPVSAEAIAARCGLGFDALAAALGQLERDGWVARVDGWIERRARPPTIRGGAWGPA